MFQIKKDDIVAVLQEERNVRAWDEEVRSQRTRDRLSLTDCRRPAPPVVVRDTRVWRSVDSSSCPSAAITHTIVVPDPSVCRQMMKTMRELVEIESPFVGEAGDQLMLMRRSAVRRGSQSVSLLFMHSQPMIGSTDRVLIHVLAV